MVSLLVLVAVVSVIAFGVGALALPAYAYVVKDGIPVISPLVGRLLFILGAFANGANVLHYRADGRYEMQAAAVDERDPREHWTRLALRPFGVSYERSEDTFGHELREYDLEYFRDESPEADKLPGNRHPIDITRGGMKSFIRTDLTDDFDADALFIAAGEKLAEMRDSAGLEVPNRTHMEALEDHGGDRGEYDTLEMGAISVVFAILGAAIPYVVLFL